MIKDITQNILFEQELNVFVRSVIIHNLRTLSIKGSSVTSASQVFISPKLQKIEKLGVGVVSNLHTRFHDSQMVQKLLVGHTHKHIKHADEQHDYILNLLRLHRPITDRGINVPRTLMKVCH